MQFNTNSYRSQGKNNFQNENIGNFSTQPTLKDNQFLEDKIQNNDCHIMSHKKNSNDFYMKMTDGPPYKR